MERMYIRVFVTPDAKREKVEALPPKSGGAEGGYAISVREPAQGNRANDRVRELVARELQCTVAQVRILTGHHARVKMISVSS